MWLPATAYNTTPSVDLTSFEYFSSGFSLIRIVEFFDIKAGFILLGDLLQSKEKCNLILGSCSLVGFPGTQMKNV
ncbi:hypothetical protein Vadar_000699 [Vaccinium darrowii]|uniref:Uncharacterized protein n=1 Tax=Vaccinium darrowii TaxID=229202 RepID=A0ACB7XM61_9ERIC|nr:hypothetical protein Vadar_000699 [Vaccinium darrowii]